MDLLPRFPLRTLNDLATCADWIHEDRCQWIGEDSPRPCTCGVPAALRALADAAAVASAADGDDGDQPSAVVRELRS